MFDRVKKIILKVKAYEGKPVFQSQNGDGQGGVMLDNLPAQDEFVGGSLEVFDWMGHRKDKTTGINHRGTYVNYVAFEGLSNIYPADGNLAHKGEKTSKLHADEFSHGDQLVISFNGVSNGFNFDETIQGRYRALRQAGETVDPQAPFEAELPEVLRF